jgi:hypothetical protein
MPMAATFPQLQLTPTVQAAAYAAGQSVGGLLTFSNAVTEVAGSAMVQSATVTFASGVQPQLDLVLFSANALRQHSDRPHHGGDCHGGPGEDRLRAAPHRCDAAGRRRAVCGAGSGQVAPFDLGRHGDLRAC